MPSPVTPKTGWRWWRNFRFFIYNWKTFSGIFMNFEKSNKTKITVDS